MLWAIHLSKSRSITMSRCKVWINVWRKETMCHINGQLITTRLQFMLMLDGFSKFSITSETLGWSCKKGFILPSNGSGSLQWNISFLAEASVYLNVLIYNSHRTTDDKSWETTRHSIYLKDPYGSPLAANVLCNIQKVNLTKIKTMFQGSHSFSS